MAKKHSQGLVPQQKVLKEVLDSPMLPVLVEQLPAGSISQLIDQVGVENSNALIVHASSEQIRQVLDIQLWTPEPGAEDQLNIDDFFLWLHTWSELGAEFVCDKLEDLGDEYVALFFSRYLTATDKTKVGLGNEFDFANFGREFGDYDVVPRGGIDEIVDEQIWVTLLNALEDLNQHRPEFLEVVLRRCSFVRSILNEDISEHDVTGELKQQAVESRETRSEQEGFVVATDAFAFLSISRNADMANVLASVQYDELSRRYFRLAKVEPTQSVAPLPQDLSELLSTLKGVGIGTENDPKPLLLTNQSKQLKRTLLDQTLLDLRQDSPLLFDKRAEEILYLSNVLIAGVGFKGKPFSKENAVKAAKATCNLGLEYLKNQQDIASDEVYFELLSPEPGLLRPFQLGFNLLNQVPLRCAEALHKFLSGKLLRNRLRRQPDIAVEIDHLLPGDIFPRKVQERRFEELADDIASLTLVLDQVAVHTLRHAIDAFPAFPRILGMDPQPIRLDASIRFIQTLQDLDTIHSYCTKLRVDI